MPTRRSPRKLARTAAHAHARGSLKKSAPVGHSGSKSAEDAREYIADMAGSLAELALANHLDSLATACDVVREIAEGNVSAQARLIRYS